MKRRFAIGCSAVIVAAALGVAGYLATQVPGVSQQLPPNSAPLMVSLTRPKEGDAYPVSGALPVDAQAIGSVPVDRLELWADGALAETFSAPIQGLAVLDNTWNWTPHTLGDHTLFVRAVDSAGRDALSNVVHMKAVPDPGLVLVTPAQQNDTPEKLAQKYGTSVTTILRANPGLKAGNAIPTGQDVFIKISPGNAQPAPAASNPPPLPNTPTDLALPGSPNSLVFWVQKNAPGGFTPDRLASAPILQGGAQGCSARVLFSDTSDNESGFYVYRLDPQASAFARIATLQAHSGDQMVEFDDDRLSGGYQYYVAAYNTAGKRASNIVSVSVNDSACAASSHIVRLNDLVAANTDGLDRAYLYVNLDGGNWTRVPQDKSRFLDPKAPIRLADVGALVLPGQTPMHTLSGEAWGWKRGSLVPLGTFSKDMSGLPSAPSPVRYVGPFTMLEARGWVANLSKNKWEWYDWQGELSIDDKNQVRGTFRWTTASGVTHGMVQVSVEAFTDNADLNPPGMVLVGNAPKPGPGAAPVEFPFDFSPLVVKKVAPASPQAPLIEFPFDIGPLGVKKVAPASPGTVRAGAGIGIIKSPPFAPPFQPSALPATPAQVPLQPALMVVRQSQNAQRSMIFSPNPVDLTLPERGINTFYMRVLPMNGNQVVGKPSNTVVIHYSPYDPPQYQIPSSTVVFDYDVKILNFTPTHFADEEYALCVQVLKNPWYQTHSMFAVATGWDNAEPGKPACPLAMSEDSGGVFGVLEDALNFVVNAVEAGVDFVSDLYDKIDSFVKEWASKLNVYCLEARFAADAVGKGGDTVNDVCNKVASMSVDAVKAFYGIPPSLPNFDELTSMGEDYLVDQAADQLEFACPDECKEMIRKGVRYATDRLKSKNHVSPSCIDPNAAEALGLIPLCPIEGVEVMPDPRGQYAPALLTVRLTRPRLPNPLAPDVKRKACDLGIQNTYTNNFWGDKQHGLHGMYGDIDWKGPFGGELFYSSRRPVPKIEEGQSITITVPLDPARLPSWVDFWLWNVKYHGAQVTLEARCGLGKSDEIKAGPLIMPLLKEYYGSP